MKAAPAMGRKLMRQADVLLCADLFAKELFTSWGQKRAFVLIVMHVRSRSILLAEATFSPHADWMAQQVRNVLWQCDDLGHQPRFLSLERDNCFCVEFDAVLRGGGVRPILTPYHAPNANAFAERWIRSIHNECMPPHSGGLNGRKRN